MDRFRLTQSKRLQRLRQQWNGELVYAPDFRRNLEAAAAAAGATPVFANTPWVITEGHSLLRQDGGWPSVTALLDEVCAAH